MSKHSQRMNQFSTSKDVAKLNPAYYGGKVETITPKPQEAALPRLKPLGEKMNRWEKQWLEVLQTRYPEWVHIQSVTLKLGHDCRYTPDFVCYKQAGISVGLVRAYEVKGFFRDDAKVKIKVAARQYPWITFILVTKEDGVWKEEMVPS